MLFFSSRFYKIVVLEILNGIATTYQNQMCHRFIAHFADLVEATYIYAVHVPGFL